MKKLIHKFLASGVLQKQTIIQATVLITILSLLSKFVGFGREVLIAKYFGTSLILDAYLVGSQIPKLVLGIFAGGFGMLIIPKYLEYKKKGNQDATRYVNQIFVVWGVIFLCISILTVIFAGPLVRIVAIGFKGERYDLAVLITRYLSLYGLLNILISLLIGLFQAEKQFLVPAIIYFVSNVLAFISLVFLHPYLGIQSLTLGSTISVAFIFILLFVNLYKKHHFFHFLSLQINWIEIRDFAYLLFPLLISSGVGTLNALVDRTIASLLPVGSISAINFASRIWGLPLTLIAGSLTVTLLPSFSKNACDLAKLPDLKQTINKSLIFMFYFLVPISVLFLTLSVPIVRLFYERGAFDNTATLLTASINRMYALGLTSFATYVVLVNVFYSFKNTWTPLWLSVGILTLNFIGNMILSKIMGAPGIALSTSIAMTLGYIVAYYYLGRYFRKCPEGSKASRINLISEFLRILACSLVIGGLSLSAIPALNRSVAFLPSVLKVSGLFLFLSILYLYLSSACRSLGYTLIKPYLGKLPLVRKVLP